MGTTEFDFDVVLPFAILGFLLTVGYVIWAWQRSGKNTGAENRRPGSRLQLEVELREELERLNAARAEDDPDADMALDLPSDARRQQQEIRQAVEQSPPPQN